MPTLPKRMVVSFVAYEGVPDDIRFDIMSARAEAKMIECVNNVRVVNGYVPVALFEYDDRLSIQANMETVYKAMQNGVITDSWTLFPPDGLTALVDPIKHDGQDMGHRSMSMGDMVEYGGNQYVVATFGFLRLP
jgi:hypothetical protein